MALLIDDGYKNFIIRRFIRIYPPYFIAVVCIIVMKVLLLGSITQDKLLYSITLLPFGSIPYTLNIEWTLIYEIFFYVVCAIFTMKDWKKFFPYFLVAWGILIGIINCIYSVPEVFLPTIMQIPFQTVNFFFITGGLMYYIHKKEIKIAKIPGIIAIVMMIIITCVFFNQFMHINLWVKRFNSLILGVMFAVIVFLVLNIEFKPNKYIQKLGDYSYGMYLIHAQVMFILLTIIKEQFEMPINTVNATIVLIIAFSVGIYFGKFEVEMHKVLRQYTKTRYKMIYKYTIIVCLIGITLIGIKKGMTMYKVIKIQNILSNSEWTLEEFDRSNVVASDETAGWLDAISNNNIEVNTEVTMRGWAINPEKLEPAKDIVLVCNEKVIPSEVNWYARPNLIQVLGSEGVLNAGWELKFNTAYLGSGVHQIEVYAVTEEGNYIRLQSTKDTNSICIN